MASVEIHRQELLNVLNRMSGDHPWPADQELVITMANIGLILCECLKVLAVDAEDVE